MRREIGLGAAAGLALFLALQGVNILPGLFLLGLLYVLVQATGVHGWPRPMATLSPGTGPGTGVTFDDVGGQETAKRELTEALEFITRRDEAERLGIRPLRGILLTGPPGTGKTMLAKAAATFTGAAFVAAAGSSFIEVYAGVGAQRVRRLFQQAREAARHARRDSAVIFIDELEVLGHRRGSHQSHLEYDQTLNQLLVEMDGLSASDDVRLLVIGATNRADLLDPALLRPGRFDRVVKVDMPDRAGRRHILELHARGKPLAEDADLDAVARETFGFSGAHLENLVNEAAILALREGSDRIAQAHLTEAIDKVILGEKVERRPSAAELDRVACHEAGHAIMAELARPGSVATVTIAPRGEALGFVRQTPDDDRYLLTQEYLEGRIRVALGGTVAEEISFGTRSTGAASDLEQAVGLARTLVLAGMSPLGIVGGDVLPDRELHRAIQAILRRQEDAARRALEARRDALASVAAALREQETISGDGLRDLISGSEARARAGGAAAGSA